MSQGTSPGRILVVGSANLDLVVSVERRPTGGETVRGSDLRTGAGGKGANQAVAAGLLGGHVTFVGCVGDDAGGALLRAWLARAGVDISHLHETSTPTGTAVILLTPDGENSIVVSPGANRHVTPALLDQADDLWSAAAVLVVQLEVPLETVEATLRRAGAAGVRAVVNAAPAALLSRETLALADPLVVNETEAAFLLGLGPDRLRLAQLEGGEGADDVGALATALLAAGARSVVLTLGGRGAVTAEHVAGGPPRATHVPAQRVAVVDTTGAGDCFVGALAVCLAEGADLRTAARRAGLAAAYAVARLGAQDSYPSRTQVW